MRVVIVGGGASGVLSATYLLNQHILGLQVVLIEPKELGAGAAYGTDKPEHLLNVATAKMSAYPDDPDHFLRWMRQNAPCDPNAFVSRSLYRHYLQHVLDDAVAGALPNAWKVYQSSVTSIIPHAEGATITLETGQILHTHKIILAVGNQPPRTPETDTPWFAEDEGYINTPWISDLAFITPDDDILLIGTGLTTVDVLLSLNKRGHRGQITAVSRHGRWPLSHAENTVPVFDITTPIPHDALEGFRWVRRAIHQAQYDNIPWQTVLDALRSHINLLWAQASHAERCRFTRHLMPLWNIARHRIPHNSAMVIENLTNCGQLRLITGRLRRVDRQNSILSATISHHKTGDGVYVYPRWILNCTGPNTDLHTSDAPLLRQLFADGHLTTDPLRMGLNTAPNGAVINHIGMPSEVIYTLGSLRRGGLFESTAIHEIRQQAMELSQLLANLILVHE